MIRHPVLRLVQLALGVLVALLGAWAQARPAPRSPPMALALSAVGERECDDGSWEGSDLLAQPGAPAERFQLNIRPLHAGRLLVDELTPEGTQRLSPALGEDGRVSAGKSYALPGPHAFYERSGAVHLRVTLLPADGALPGPELATPLSATARRSYRLSDGAPAQVTEVLYQGGASAVVELSFPASP
jgi:hypothetical protein